MPVAMILLSLLRVMIGRSVAVKAFSELHADLYRPAHIEQGGIHAMDRYGQPLFYPLLSLSIGAVKFVEFDKILIEADLAEHASKAKSAAKKLAGNSLFQLQPSELSLLSIV